MNDGIPKLLYETALEQLDKEKDRKDRLESKGERLFTFDIAIFGLLTFLFKIDSFHAPVFLVFFTIFYLIIICSAIFAIISAMKMDNYNDIGVRSLIIEVKESKIKEEQDLLKRLAGTYSEFCQERGKLNNARARIIKIGYFILLIGFLFGAMAMICYIFGF